MDPRWLPAVDRESFYCPHSDCGVRAEQFWGGYINAPLGPNVLGQQSDFKVSACHACDGIAIWHLDQMIYPAVRNGEPPHLDMPHDVMAIYDEARAVAPVSRRSAAGLLRLALQMLIDELEPGEASIHRKIGNLVQNGLDPQVQQAMDVLRVVGNENVHPGEIDLDADPELLPALYSLMNLIVEQVITRPKHVNALFSQLPPRKLQAIASRDASVSMESSEPETAPTPDSDS